MSQKVSLRSSLPPQLIRVFFAATYERLMTGGSYDIEPISDPALVSTFILVKGMLPCKLQIMIVPSIDEEASC